MKRIFKIIIVLLVLQLKSYSQTNNPSPYCAPVYLNVPCNQGGPSNSPSAYINDNINNFSTSGAVVNISNLNSGCNGMANNYIYYCHHNLQVNPNTVISCSLQSGITSGQGFAIFIDWNQDNVFQIPSERVAATNNGPAAIQMITSFSVPVTQANGIYRMRVRSVYATSGYVLDPCNTVAYGECEDYNVYVGITVPAPLAITASASVNSPICAGQTASLSAISSSTNGYLWSGPLSYSSNLQNPTLANTTSSNSGTYYVAVTTGTCPVIKGTYLSVVSGPSLTVNSNQNPLCVGNSATLSAISNPPAISYSWSTGSNTLTTVITPTVNTSYTISASNGTCIASKVITQSVSICTNLNDNNNFLSLILVYPNPVLNNLVIETYEELELKLYNLFGQLLIEKRISSKENIDFSSISKGIYYLGISNGVIQKTVKITKE
jgi:hypothetical protein